MTRMRAGLTASREYKALKVIPEKREKPEPPERKVTKAIREYKVRRAIRAAMRL